MNTLRPWIQLARPEQWIKNILLFAPLIFGERLFEGGILFQSFFAFLLFSLAGSGIYILNDICDVKEDQNHPIKQHRPLACGTIPIKKAKILMGILLILSIVSSLILNEKFTIIIIFYIVTNILYSFFLKKIVIIDVMVLSLNYVMRVIAGTVAIDVPLTHWLLVLTIFLSLFLGLSKRRHELTTLGITAHEHRASLKEYSPYFLDQMIAVVTASTVCLYSIYTLDATIIARYKTSLLPFTIPFVLYGIFRYLYLIHQKNTGGNPTNTLLNDKPLLIDIALWGLSVILIIYFF